MLDMIGVGPFITLPLLLGAMGGPQAMLGWICGALLALCDGLVWAELGAAMPEAGGTYRFLRMIYPGGLGRFLAFLFVFQLMISAPLSVASGCIGLSQYSAYMLPSLAGHTLRGAWWVAGPGTAVAIGAVLLALVLLYRNLASLRGGVVRALVHGNRDDRLDPGDGAGLRPRRDGVRLSGRGVSSGSQLLYRARKRDADCDL